MNDRRKQRDGICPKGPQHCARAFASRCNTAEPRQLPTAVEVPTPRDRLDTERDVVQRRLANFKAIQEKFQQDREEYYTRTMSDARATQWTSEGGANGS
jgi:hypothetical protein